ncbi:MAG: hypothetical protein AB7F88_17835 [Pyrinomonadaceae bacterium]
MKASLLIISAIMISSIGVFGQKGVDPQTQKIKDDSAKATSRSTDVSRSFDWGKGKTRVRDRLPNPHRFNSRRDVMIDTIANVLKEKKILIDEASSRPGEGIIVTQPYVFSKGSVITQSELRRYADIEFADYAWSKGRYVLTIEVQQLDGIQNNVSVIAKVEGLAGSALSPEWRTVPSSGQAEEEFLVKLVEAVTGVSPDDPQVTSN